jgi:hypothetical protein
MKKTSMRVGCRGTANLPGHDAARDWARAQGNENREITRMADLRTHDLTIPKPYPRIPAKKRPKLGKTIVAIPDAHFTPGVDNARAEWAARLCAHVRADYIVDIGDWFSMESMCQAVGDAEHAWSANSYSEDCHAGIDARLRFNREIDDFNKTQKKASKLNPEKHFCLGNHENRIDLYLRDHRKWMGVISTDDFRSEELGWRQHPFLEVLEISGISFAHYFSSGPMGRPISGFSVANSMVNKLHKSCVQGHLHLYDEAIRTSATGDPVIGLCVGVFTEEWMGYAAQANLMWRRGIPVLHNCTGSGGFETEWWSMDRLKATFG